MEDEIQIAVEVIIDDSGSMNVIKGLVTKGVNEFINQLATAIYPARLGVSLFDDVLRTTLIDGVSVAELPQLKPDQYDPRWGTENIAHSVIQALDKRLLPLKARQKVLVVITDGLNKSSEMDKAKALITKRQSEGWLIIWLGVCMEGYEKPYMPLLLKYAKELGIPEGLTFALPCRKIDKAMPLAAQATLRFLGSGDSKMAEFTAAERKTI